MTGSVTGSVPGKLSFFIYGSMSEGLVHFSKIQDFIENSHTAETLARAFRLKVGYPVLLEEQTQVVSGQLVDIKSSVPQELLLSLLDEFHGYNRHDESKCLHFRRLVKARVEDQVFEAWAYFLNPKKLPSNAVEIENGDWRKSLELHPPLTAQLTERQRSYVQRLGSSVGREIVPIDLGLYRELMNLELIVDKGRRLALSKLGQEVYRFLA